MFYTTLAVGDAGPTGLPVLWCCVPDCCERVVARCPRKINAEKQSNTSLLSINGTSRNGESGSASGFPPSAMPSSWLCVAREALRSAVAVTCCRHSKSLAVGENLEKTDGRPIFLAPNASKFSQEIWRNACVHFPDFWKFGNIFQKCRTFQGKL